MTPNLKSWYKFSVTTFSRTDACCINKVYLSHTIFCPARNRSQLPQICKLVQKMVSWWPADRVLRCVGTRNCPVPVSDTWLESEYECSVKAVSHRLMKLLIIVAYDRFLAVFRISIHYTATPHWASLSSSWFNINQEDSKNLNIII